jgi:hypothetical protein
VIRAWSGPPVRAGKLAAVFLTVACVAAACSSGGTPASTSKESGTPAQNSTAKSLNLRSGDLSESWTKEASNGGPNVVRNSLNSCLFSVSGSPSPAASAVSSNFLESSTGQEVGSQVQVFDTAGQATKSAINAASSGVSGCLPGDVKIGLQKTIVKTETVQTVAAKSVPALGTGRHGFAQEVAVVVGYPGKNEQQKSSTVYVEVVGFPSATALVEVEFENTGAKPPESLVTKTMQLLSARAGGQ